MNSELISVRYRDGAPDGMEIKDPSIVPMDDGTFVMYATTHAPGGPYEVGRFVANDLKGPWVELDPPEIQGIEGPGVVPGEVCAPSVAYDRKDSIWKMYLQTTYSQEDGYIALATSEDGIHFTSDNKPLISKESFPETNPFTVVSVYDVAVTDVSLADGDYQCMVYSGCRRAGCGDIYVSLRSKGSADGLWSPPALIIKQEDVPFHNHPDSPNFEWGLEGAKIEQVGAGAFLLIGVCFLDHGTPADGTRQRVFLAASPAPDQPFTPLGMPVSPTDYPQGTGENGHPETIDLGDRIAVVYQERAGRDYPWHLRYCELDKAEMAKKLAVKTQHGLRFAGGHCSPEPGCQF